jgi:hypothetical protein
MLRVDKSSKSRTAEYMLLWRLEQVFGKALVDRAVQGNAKALDKIEKFAWAGRKHPALVKWVEAKRASTNQ